MASRVSEIVKDRTAMATTSPQKSMLEKFRQAKDNEIASLLEQKKQGLMPPPFTGTRPPFCASLKKRFPAVIAEYKRASPSKGEINLDNTPEKVAQDYAQGGAGAISVLTEEKYFQGHLSYLYQMAAFNLPLLRKDFIYHPIQVERTAAIPASAILVIVRCVDDEMLATLIQTSLSYGLEPVVEVCDSEDLVRAKKANAKIIQVNNRNLDILVIDKAISAKLIPEKSADEFWITASGIETHDELLRLLNLGFDAALIGSFLMEGGTPGRKLAALIKGEE